MLMRFDPFRELDRMSEQLWRQPATASGVAMDAFRRGDHVIVHFDLPGIDPDSIDLTVERNVLTLRAERTVARQDGDEVIVSERPRGTFTRQLFLGETLDVGNIDANYEHGVLTVSIPVAEQAKPRKVNISAGANGAGKHAISASSTEA
jgi:HSP20 family protein